MSNGTNGLVWRTGPLLGKGSDSLPAISGRAKSDSVRMVDDGVCLDTEEHCAAVGQKTFGTTAFSVKRRRHKHGMTA